MTFRLNSAKFVKEYRDTVDKYRGCEESETNLVDKIELATDASIDDENDINGTLNRYTDIICLFMKVLAISDVTIYIMLCANMYECDSLYINKMLKKRIEFDTESLASLTNRMNHSKHMHFEFNKMYLSRQLESMAIVDDVNKMVTIKVVALHKDVYSKVLKFVKDISPVSDVKSNKTFLMMSLDAVATCYYNGIDGFLEIDKKLATYYQFIVYNLVKDSHNNYSNVYSKVIDMYMDAINDGIKLDIVLHSFSKLKKRSTIDPILQITEEKQMLYIVINAIKMPPSANRSCVACGATHKLKICARCKIARFCNNDCVRTAWAMHKPDCNRLVAERAE